VSSITALPLNCTDYSKIAQGAYVGASVPSGTFNTGLPYTSCINIAPTSQGVSFEAKWVTPANVVNSQQVIYGAKPGYTDSNGQLPRLAHTITHMTVAWDAELLVNSGGAGLTVNNWLSTIANPSCLTPKCGVMVELFINIKSRDWNPTGAQDPIVNIDGRDWHMRVGNFNNGQAEGTYSNLYGATMPTGMGTMQYRAFFQPLVELPNQGQVDVLKFYQYLVEHNLIPNSLYMSSNQFVVESSNGSGQLQVKNLTVDVR
jgi:hypothetical protein